MSDGPRRTQSGTRARAGIVLVVDDDQDVRAHLAEVLMDEGFAVLQATTGAEAVKTAAVIRPDVILMDRTLPDMDGVEAARLLRLDPRAGRIPVLLLTGQDMERNALVGVRLAALLSKPCHPDVLIERLRAVLDRPGRQRLA